MSPSTGVKDRSLQYPSLHWDGASLELGDFVYLDPVSVHLRFTSREEALDVSHDLAVVDENIFSEKYRKKIKRPPKVRPLPDPFKVAKRSQVSGGELSAGCHLLC